jgi:hypothetical protein
MSVHDPRVVIRTGEGLYVGWGEGDRVALYRDPRAAFVYDTDVDDVEAQIAEVHRIYGKRWTAVPLTEALAQATIE